MAEKIIRDAGTQIKCTECQKIMAEEMFDSYNEIIGKCQDVGITKRYKGVCKRCSKIGDNL